MRTFTPVRSLATLPWVTSTSGGPSWCAAMASLISLTRRRRSSESLSAP